MRPKGKLFALLAVFAAIGVITGTGAFTTVSAERTATVSVAGDSSALLQLQASSGPNGGYATETAGQLEIDLSGVNIDARTTADNVFNITNQGTQNVTVYINASSGDHTETVTFYAGPVADDNPIDSEATAYELGVGDSVSISMGIDTRNKGFTGSETLVSEITIYANAV
ncbi:MAG: DUF1102 domain-containing protein [Halobacteriales archaeon]